MLSSVRACVAFAVLAAAIVTDGAAHEPNEPMPDPGRPVALQFDDKPLAGLPAGVYRVPDSEVLVSGRQDVDEDRLVFTNVEATAQMLRQLINELVGTHHDAGAIKGFESALQRRLDGALRREVAAQLGEPSREAGLSVLGSAPFDGDIVEVSHAIVLTFVDGPKAVPFVQLSALLRDEKGRPVWRGRYSALTGAERPLDGDDGWLTNDGAALDASVSASLSQAVRIMLADVSRHLPRDPARLVRVRTQLPFRGEAFYVVGYLLDEDARYATITVQSRTEKVIPGIVSIDKSLVDARPARDGLGVAVDVNTTPRGRALKAQFDARMARQRAREAAQAAQAASTPEAAQAVSPEPAASQPTPP